MSWMHLVLLLSVPQANLVLIILDDRQKQKKERNVSCLRLLKQEEYVAKMSVREMRIRKRYLPTTIVTLISLIVTVSSSTSTSDPCLDGQDENPTRLHLPSQYANLTPPWQRTDGKFAKVKSSDGLTYHWSWLKSLKLKGFSSTVEDVIAFLGENNCLFVPVGPFVRSLLLSRKSVYVSGEVSCELHQIYDKCVLKFGSAGCSLFPTDGGGFGDYRMEIGDASANLSTYAVRAEPIVLYEWRSVLGSPWDKWRFTVDTLAMFDDGAGEIYLIDPTGTGYIDVCEKKLAPASNDWEKWSDNQPIKMMGFYDLRTEGFAPQNVSLHKFVNKKIEVSDMLATEKFYCEHVLKGVTNLKGKTPVCHTMYPKKEASKRITQMRTIMIREMDNSWNTSIGKAADDLQAVFCTSRQFVDIRSRLLHRIPSAHDEAAIVDKPKIIEEGRPMINDSAQIHARPILDMAAQVPDLPQEYPSAPRAHPNENLEFVETPLVEDAGKDPTAIQVNGSHDDPEPMQNENGEDDEQDATRNDGGIRQEEDTAETDYSRHNSINNGIPVMRFDAVEENFDPIASAVSTTRESRRRSFDSLLFSCILYLLHPLL